VRWKVLSGSAAIVATTLLLGCEKGAAASSGISPQAMADALHAVMEADRTVYTKNVVNRLQNEKAIIKATERWKDEDTLPLPAQMFRMGSELVTQKNVGFTYSLISSWPINKQNAPKTDKEKAGLAFVEGNPEKVFYGEETLADKKYFTAVYPDKAVAPACVKCHNEHSESPRSDFTLGETMGGVVIRIPL
jgi:hypothetical protein